MNKTTTKTLKKKKNYIYRRVYHIPSGELRLYYIYHISDRYINVFIKYIFRITNLLFLFYYLFYRTSKYMKNMSYKSYKNKNTTEQEHDSYSLTILLLVLLFRQILSL